MMLSVSCLFTVLNLNAAEGVEFFEGKWKVLVEGTPSGDAEMIIALAKNSDGDLEGTIGMEGKPDAKINRVEVKDESITLYWVSSGYDVYLFMEKVDDMEIEGTLMDMFDAYGERMKK